MQKSLRNKSYILPIVIIIGLTAYQVVNKTKDKDFSASKIQFNHHLIDNKSPDEPWGKSVGDINNDGIIDMVVSGYGSKDLYWYDGNSKKKSLIATGYKFTTDHELADVDNDGLTDIVSLTKDGIVWFKNPHWEPNQIAHKQFHDLELDDFDLDGDLDVVARDQSAFGGSGKTITILKNNNSINWDSFILPVPDGEGLAVADIDGDNKSDIIVNNQWYKNPGKINEKDWIAYTYGDTWKWPHTYITIADINNDNRTDIILSPAEKEGDYYHISWFEAPLDRTMTWKEHIVVDNVETVHHFVGAEDMDNDGDIDIVTAEMHQGKDPDEVVIYKNYGNGSKWYKQILSEHGSHSMRLFDIESDGDVDLFGANWSGDYTSVELWENLTCNVNTQKWTRHVIDDSKPWTSIFIYSADLDSDGFRDIITGGWWYKNPVVPEVTWERIPFGEKVNNVAAVFDIDGDGFNDILATEGKGAESNSKFAWAKNDGQGHFYIHHNIPEGTGDFLQGVAIAKYLNDRMGVALSWHKHGQGIQLLTVPENPTTEKWQLDNLSRASQDEALSSADIDNDKDIDLVLGTEWLRNEQEWKKNYIYKTLENPDRNVVADINGDGKLDVVIGYEAISKEGKLAWYQASDDVTHPWEEHKIADVIGPMSLDVADMDKDGDLDVVVGEHNLVDPGSARLMIYYNTSGDGTNWRQELVYRGDEHHDGAQVVDIDNDGDNDIISIGWGHNRVLMYENKSNTCGRNISIFDAK